MTTTETKWTEKTWFALLNIILVGPIMGADGLVVMKLARWFLPALAFGFYQTLGAVLLVRLIVRKVELHEEEDAAEKRFKWNVGYLFLALPCALFMGWVFHVAQVTP